MTLHRPYGRQKLWAAGTFAKQLRANRNTLHKTYRTDRFCRKVLAPDIATSAILPGVLFSNNDTRFRSTYI